MSGCRKYIMMLFLGLGLSLGGGVIYVIMTNESWRMVALFAAGLMVAGLPLMSLLVWMLKIVSMQRVNHNYSYKVPQPTLYYPHGQPGYNPQAQQQPAALGSGDGYDWNWNVVNVPQSEEEDAPIA